MNRKDTEMVKIAVYGKGGIGKSTTVSNVSAALADMGYKVMQIGCDPKADSTSSLHGQGDMTTVLDLVREHKNAFELSDMVKEGYGGVICVEAGGPTPGLGCAGRGIIAALDKLKEKGAYETFKPDVVIYDVLGDVVCGGFSMPMRGGYADKVFVITSGENMAIHAAANIAVALDGVIGELSRSETVTDAEDLGKTVIEAFPDSEMAGEYRKLAKTLLDICNNK